MFWDVFQRIQFIVKMVYSLAFASSYHVHFLDVRQSVVEISVSVTAIVTHVCT